MRITGWWFVTLRFLRSVSARMSQFLLHNVSIKCDSINGATNDLLSALIKTSHECVGAALGQRTKIMLERANRATPHRWKFPVLIQKLNYNWPIMSILDSRGHRGTKLHRFTDFLWLAGSQIHNFYNSMWSFKQKCNFAVEFVTSLVQFTPEEILVLLQPGACSLNQAGFGDNYRLDVPLQQLQSKRDWNSSVPETRGFRF